MFIISPSGEQSNRFGADKPDWTEINFYEDIYSPTISGDITINDGGLMENVPIVGEILEISMSTGWGSKTMKTPIIRWSNHQT